MQICSHDLMQRQYGSETLTRNPYLFFIPETFAPFRAIQDCHSGYKSEIWTKKPCLVPFSMFFWDGESDLFFIEMKCACWVTLHLSRLYQVGPTVTRVSRSEGCTNPIDSRNQIRRNWHPLSIARRSRTSPPEQINFKYCSGQAKITYRGCPCIGNGGTVRWVIGGVGRVEQASQLDVTLMIVLYLRGSKMVWVFCGDLRTPILRYRSCAKNR